jgi:hypothetical protein
VLRKIGQQPGKEPPQMEQSEPAGKGSARRRYDPTPPGLFGTIRIQQQRPRHPGIWCGLKDRYQPFDGAGLNLAIRVEQKYEIGVAGPNADITRRAKSEIGIVSNDGDAIVPMIGQRFDALVGGRIVDDNDPLNDAGVPRGLHRI